MTNSESTKLAMPGKTFGWLADVLRGELVEAFDGCCDKEWSRLETDSRAVGPDDVFVALAGERFDGHDFIAKARERGAAAVIAERRVDVDIPQFIVKNARAAYGLVAKAWRAQFSLLLAAVGGSNGKTTTTQMFASILRVHWGKERTHSTTGNLNNEIGVPRTLLGLRFEHRGAVIEAGMNHRGEMARLADWIRPNVVLITNAQREHQEFMGSVAETAHENGLLIPALSESGTAVFPADDDCAPIWAALALARGVKQYTYATGPTVAGIEPDLVGTNEPDGTLKLVGKGVELVVRLKVTGEHNRHNAVGAAAAALAAGIPAEAVRVGLEVFSALRGRGERWTSDDGCVTVIDDAYNANPDSVLASMSMLAAEVKAVGGVRSIYVLGDMGEIGNSAEACHEEVGAFAKRIGIDALWTAGDTAKFAAEAFGAGARHFDSVEALVEALLKSEAQTKDRAVVVVKASRFMRFERIVDALKGEL